MTRTSLKLYVKSKGKKRISKRKVILVCIIIAVFISVLTLAILRNRYEKEKAEVINPGKNGEYIKNPKKILGSWSTEDGNIYFFDEDGTGYLRVPLEDYIFTYNVVGEKLYINFQSEKAKDSDYVISFKEIG